MTTFRCALVLASAGALLAPVGAAARVDALGRAAQESPKLVSPTFTVTGHGWGHGVGMSQYGALGFALRGTPYRRILAHYYRGTALGTAGLRRVRVLLADGRKQLTIASAAPFTVRDGAGKSHAVAAGRVTFGPGLSIKVDIAEQPRPLTGPLLFSAGAAPLQLGRPYRGQLQVSVVEGKLRAVNSVGLEQYLYGVVPSEVPYSWPAEALKAQAVAARSYALSHLQTGSFDLFDDVRSQVYLGIEHEQAATNAAVDATARQVLLYEGKVASTFFFSTSGGRTMSAADAWGDPVPYLVSVPDPYDTLSPYHDWGPFAFPASRLTKTFRVQGDLVDVRTTRNKSGRADLVTAAGTEGEVTLSAPDVRRELGLRSTWFEFGILALARRTSTAPVVYGSQLALAGVARGLPAVALEERLPGASAWAPVGSLKPAKDGAFTVGVKPSVTTRYRLVSGTVASAPLRVPVAPLVRFYSAREATSLRGLVRPVLAAALVEIQRQDEAGNWRAVVRTTVDARGDFRANVRLTPGSYRARVFPGRGFVAGQTKVLRVLG
jgi:SpoIID/LytB domain protein